MSARIATVWLLLLVGGCDTASSVPSAAPEASEPGSPRPARPPVVVGWSALRISLPVFVAEQHRLFDAEGLEVELRRYDTAQPLVEELVDARIDAGGYAALPIVLTVADRARTRVRVATAMIEDEDHPVSYLLCRRGSEIGTTADLRGRRVGVLPTLAYTQWLRLVLAQAGVEPSSVTIVPLAPPLEVQALAEGGVDALFTGDPIATAALASGVGERLGPAAPVPLALGGPHVFGVFLVSEALARERPEDAAALVRALDAAIALIADDPLGSRSAMVPHLPEADRDRVGLYPPSLYLPSTALDDARLLEEVARIVSSGAAPAAPDVHGWSLRGGSE